MYATLRNRFSMTTNLHHYLLFVLLLLGQFLNAQDAGLNIANAEISNIAQAKNYTPSDILQPIITDDYVSGGIRHIYYQQAIDQIGIFGTSGSVHLKDNKVIASNLQFLPQVEKRTIKREFQLVALQTVASIAQQKGYLLSQTEILILEADDNDPQKSTTVSSAGISNRTIPLKLVYWINQKEELQLAWSVFIDEVEGAAYKNFLVDAETGNILQENNLTITCNFGQKHNHDYTDTRLKLETKDRPKTKENLYSPASESANIDSLLSKSSNLRQVSDYTDNSLIINELNDIDAKVNFHKKSSQSLEGDSLYNVIPFDIESPNFGERAIIMNPWKNALASPNGWHSMFGNDYTHTLGNNINAYSDRDNTNDPTGDNAARAGGGTDLIFDYDWTKTGNPTDYTKAAITNLFYIGNTAHDIFYNYGFDEVSGNFQEDNFNKGGRGSDNVLSEAQDALGTCNANFSTPGDGANPRMQMYLCAGRDGDFDNAVILHEYGHGVSIRLTGGPQAVGCLGNVEQMGEGWSDWFGMVMTMQPRDTSTTQRTIGTWLFNQDSLGAGLRPYPYTTDMTVNPMTYKTIDDVGISRPHGVGAVWATMLWDMTWAFIDQYGWDGDLHNGTGGNNIALKLVMEGLKLQPCSPGFVDARDAILAADLTFYNGVNRCLIWEAFARRGLGYSADQQSSNSREDGIEAYDMPPECTIELKHTVDRPNAHPGERLTFELEAINHLNAIATNIIVTDTLPENAQFYSVTEGGVLNGNIIEWPAFDLPVGGNKKMELKVTINDIIQFDPNFTDSLLNGGDNWIVYNKSPGNNWLIQTQHFSSANAAWFIENVDSTSETHLILKKPLALTDTSQLIFTHLFDLEDGYDFGLVDISLDGGQSWINLQDDFIQNGYNRNTQFGHTAFNHLSAPVNNVATYMTSIADLSPYAGEVVLIRFRLLTDITIGRFGWVVDDISITNTKYVLSNFGNIRNGEYDFETFIENPTIIGLDIINHTVETQADTLISTENAGISFVNVQVNDIDPDSPADTLVTSILHEPSNGIASVINKDSISYTPNGGFSGLDTLIYEVCDIAGACESDTVFVFINEVNKAPIAVTDFLTIDENTLNSIIDVQANDSDPDGIGDTLTTSILEFPMHGAAVVVDKDSIRYTPEADYFGLDTLLYQVCDTSMLCASDTVFIIINEMNEAPIAVTDFLVIDGNTLNSIIDVQANDSDPNGEGDTLVTFILAAPMHGTAVVVDEDSIRYTPETNYFGLDTIVYQVCDTSMICASDTVFITINVVNGALICNSVDLDKNENGIASGNYVASNDIYSSGVIGTGAVVNFLASNSITLYPGFHAQSGADFTAQISTCIDDGKLVEENDYNEDRNASNTSIEEVGKNTLLVRPNPFRDIAIIDYELAENSSLWIGIYNATGKLMDVFVNQFNQEKGIYQYYLSAHQLPSGIYWLTMKTENSILTKKILILKN